jgi:hypothetical protein
MSDALTYDLMLETTGILRPRDFRGLFDRDLEPGQTIELCGRRWLVTKVEARRGEVLTSTDGPSPTSFRRLRTADVGLIWPLS